MNTEPDKPGQPPPDPMPPEIDAPDLGGSFEENGQRRLHDGVGAGPGLEVLDEGLRAARTAEKNSSAGS